MLSTFNRNTCNWSIVILPIDTLARMYSCIFCLLYIIVRSYVSLISDLRAYSRVGEGSILEVRKNYICCLPVERCRHNIFGRDDQQKFYSYARCFWRKFLRTTFDKLLRLIVQRFCFQGKPQHLNMIEGLLSHLLDEKWNTYVQKR